MPINDLLMLSLTLMLSLSLTLAIINMVLQYQVI